MIMDMILTCLGEVYGSNSGLGFGECCSGSSRDQRCAGGGGGGHGDTARHHHGGHSDIPARPWAPMAPRILDVCQAQAAVVLLRDERLGKLKVAASRSNTGSKHEISLKQQL